jgi:hypothetical protein
MRYVTCGSPSGEPTVWRVKEVLGIGAEYVPQTILIAIERTTSFVFWIGDVRKEQREVSPLSRGVMWLPLNPYPPHYRTAFACFLLPSPPCYRLTLRLAVPLQERDGLTAICISAETG